MLSKYLGSPNGEWGIQKDRRRGHCTAFHQINEINDQFLSTFNGKGRNEHGALGDRCVANLDSQAFATGFGGRWRAVGIAIGRLRNNIVKSSWRFWVRLEQLRVRTNVARGKNPQLLPR